MAGTDEAEVQAAMTAGMAAVQARMDHYETNVHGQGAGAGDPKPWPPGSEPDVGQSVSET